MLNFPNSMLLTPFSSETTSLTNKILLNDTLRIYVKDYIKIIQVKKIIDSYMHNYMCLILSLSISKSEIVQALLIFFTLPLKQGSKIFEKNTANRMM